VSHTITSDVTDCILGSRAVNSTQLHHPHIKVSYYYPVQLFRVSRLLITVTAVRIQRQADINFNFRQRHRRKKGRFYLNGAMGQCNPGSPSFRVYFLSVMDGRRKLL